MQTTTIKEILSLHFAALGNISARKVGEATGRPKLLEKNLAGSPVAAGNTSARTDAAKILYTSTVFSFLCRGGRLLKLYSIGGKKVIAGVGKENDK